MDAKVAEIISNVSVKSHNSATTFTKDQQKTLELTWDEFFSRNRTRVAHVEAHNVKIDEITSSSLDEIPGGIPFVFSGLRADSCTITFRRSTKTIINIDSMVASVKQIYPAMTETELGQFIALLKMKYIQKDSTDFDITVKQPNVYFMVQVAEYGVLGKSGMVDWQKAGSSFPDMKTGGLVDSFVLFLDKSPYKTGSTKIKFSRWSKGDQADVWIEVDSLGKLYAKYKTAKMKDPGSKLLTEDREVRIYDNVLVSRYPYGNTNNSEKYKDISLTIRARREDKKIIIDSNAKYGRGNNVLGSTFIYYPEVRFKWKSFSP